MSRSWFALTLFLCVSAVLAEPAATPKPPLARGPYGAATRIAVIEADFIDEASGLASSRATPGILWTHNDSGDDALLYAIDRRGKTRGVFRLPHAESRDWEDIAAGPGPDGKGRFLYIGDIGDNGRVRKDATVYRIPEPAIGSEPGSKKKPRTAGGPLRELPFRYPDGAHDAEALLVHPRTGDIYIVTKEWDGNSGVYVFPRPALVGGGTATLRRVGGIRISDEQHFFPNLVTGGDISPDGKRVILRTYAAAYEWTLPAGAASFDAIWKTQPALVALPPMVQGEAIAYSADGRSLLTTSEKSPAPLYELRRK